MFISKVLLLAATASAQLPDGFAYTIDVDPVSGMLQFDVTIPEDTYFGIAFGKGMVKVDMVRFVGSGGGSVEDLWSKFYGSPDRDVQDDYQNTQVVKNGGSYTFTTYRELVTSDPNNEDYQFNNNDPKEMQWVANVNTSDLKKHTHDGEFTLSFASDGSV